MLLAQRNLKGRLLHFHRVVSLWCDDDDDGEQVENNGVMPFREAFFPLIGTSRSCSGLNFVALNE